MKAIVLHEHGGVEKLVAAEVPTPEPGRGEVRVKVKACALNHLDIWVRQGFPGRTLPMPHILGCESSGVVDAIGEGVKGLAIGQRVLVLPGFGCGECDYCRSARDSECAQFVIRGMGAPGGYAEYVVAPARTVVPVSEKLSWEEWAALPLVYTTAWHMLMSRAGGLKPGDLVLVQAAGSGVGMAAIEIARNAGAKVIATAGSNEKCEAARDLGADEVINYRREDFVERTRSWSGGRGVDVVIEHIGGETLEKSLKCLARGGKLVTCGVTSGPTATIDVRYLFMNHLSIVGSYMGSTVEMRRVVALAEEGRLRPKIDSVFPLAQAREAHQRMLDRENFGKIVLRVD